MKSENNNKIIWKWNGMQILLRLYPHPTAHKGRGRWAICRRHFMAKCLAPYLKMLWKGKISNAMVIFTLRRAWESHDANMAIKEVPSIAREMKAGESKCCNQKHLMTYGDGVEELAATRVRNENNENLARNIANGNAVDDIKRILDVCRQSGAGISRCRVWCGGSIIT